MRINIHGAISLESGKTRMTDVQTVRTHSVSGFVGAILGTRASDRVVGAHLIHGRGAGRATAGRSVAPAENTTSPPGGTCRKWGLGIGCKELARSRVLSTGLSIAYLRSLGLPSLFGAG